MSMLGRANPMRGCAWVQGDLYAFADTLVRAGFTLNDEGGIMKVTTAPPPPSPPPGCHPSSEPATGCQAQRDDVGRGAAAGRAPHASGRKAAQRLPAGTLLQRSAAAEAAAAVLTGRHCRLQVSPDSGLLQCSTVADVNDFRFADGQVRPPGPTRVHQCQRPGLPPPPASSACSHGRPAPAPAQCWQAQPLPAPALPALCIHVRPTRPACSVPGPPQVHPVAAAYLEFVERKPLPQHEQLPPTQLTERHRRDGFEAASADKIFHSTTLAASGLKQRGST